MSTTKSHVKDAKKFANLSRARQVEVLMGVRLTSVQRDLIDYLADGDHLEATHRSNRPVS